jgi:hypothetical protein
MHGSAVLLAGSSCYDPVTGIHTINHGDFI